MEENKGNTCRRKMLSCPPQSLSNQTSPIALLIPRKAEVATVDIPGVFMQADINKLVHMKLEENMAELLIKREPNKFVQI